MNIPINIYKDEKGYLIAECSLLPGFHTYGENQAQLDANLKELISLYEELIINGEIEIPNISLISVSFSTLEINNTQNVRVGY